MDRKGIARSEASRDFQQARWQASLETLAARLTGKSTELLSFSEVTEKLHEVGRTARGLQQIPVNAIVGSVGRTSDFTRTFLPRLEEGQDRWINVRTAAYHVSDLPPIEVYQIGDAYFVSDGNHRVSIARRQGVAFIDAYVTEVRTRVSLTPDVQPDDLIILAEHAAFLERTRLDELYPYADFQVSVPGQYAHLENLVEVHRYFQEIVEARELSEQEAVGHWYTNAYMPMIVAIREQGILRYFPGRTETDFYVWLATHRKLLEHELGWPIRPEVAVSRLVERIRPQPENLAQRMSRAVLNLVSPRPWPSPVAAEAWTRERSFARYSGRLFADVLIPLALPMGLGQAPPGWAAMDLALAIATPEGALLCGLLFVPPGDSQNDALITVVRQHFEHTCRTVGIQGVLAVEWGNAVERICDRTAMLDLVVLGRDFLYGGHPNAKMDAESGDLELFIRRSCRPILLAGAGQRTLAHHALLVYDSEPQSQEALFLAVYIAEQWQTQLTVMTLNDGRTRSRNNGSDNHAQQYLTLHEIEAAFHHIPTRAAEAADAICQTAAAQTCDLIIIGGYSRKEGYGRSNNGPRTPLLNHLLANWSGMLLICP